MLAQDGGLVGGTAGSTVQAALDGSQPAFGSFLEVLRREHTLYDTCFHELVRDAAAAGSLRHGEVLALLQRRCSRLLQAVPSQVLPPNPSPRASSCPSSSPSPYP